MSSPIEIKRKELELKRITMAREELEFKVMEREEEIARIRLNIGLQIEKETELQKELEQLLGK